MILGRKLYLQVRLAVYAYGMLSGKVDPLYEIIPVASPSIMWLCKLRTWYDELFYWFKSQIFCFRILFPITLRRKSVSQASSNGFRSLNLLVNIFGDGFVAKKLLLETRWERRQRAYSDNPYDIKEIDVSLSSFVG